jgi:hypothetical protein
MKEHQLPNNCYTICKSTGQCKELFDWAKANGVETKYDNYEDENCLAYYTPDLTTAIVKDCIEDGLTFMPLAEFITKLKGEWEQPNEVSVKLPKKDWEIVYKCLIAIIEEPENWQGVEDEKRILESIKEQLNQQP